MTLSRSRPNGRDFSLIELLIASSVLVIGIFGVLAALTAQAQTRMFSNENEFAAHLIENVLADYHAHSTSALVEEVYANSDLTDTLTDTQVVVSLTVKVLSEEETTNLFPVDLDGDGALELDGDDRYDLDRDGTAGETVTFDATSEAAKAEHAGYRIVPIQVEMTWRDSSGQVRTKTVETIIYDLDVQ